MWLPRAGARRVPASPDVPTNTLRAWQQRDIMYSGDVNHHTAVRRLAAILKSGEDLLTPDTVLIEFMAILQARLGFTAATTMAADPKMFVIPLFKS